uniref:Envelope protein UL78 n=1 Tax=Mastomys natalensis cytomegalovirus 2 TaxID=2973540 RepID=A0A9Y1IQP0_9BETA|nr:envelope protein UL78 [Mastomys natalensis cytomegalovirus 2]WEG69213.1 envelope protein UL78 [Mastomys natalensis cytomegalovirus 2]WEG69352.1 envelope protein UL78 [Mastomys natalensis cytomegalovirus 2]WEG69490.1 envelope protein UL78 [Mastomys natalensis cytomegalovirus 2]WEG69628.1 envelope protein UL78 [Mastomys natalensis cytomegalovirus 2]
MANNTDLCVLPSVAMSLEMERFIITFDRATTATFSTCVGLSVCLLTLCTYLSLCRERSYGVCFYVINFWIAVFIQQVGAAAEWGMRAWCPGMVTSDYCSVVKALICAGESAASIFFMYMFVDRMCEFGVLNETEKFGTKKGTRVGTVVWMGVLAWLSSVMMAYPLYATKAAVDLTGTASVCEMVGSDGIVYMMLQYSSVLIVPSLIVCAKIVEIERKSDKPAVWRTIYKAYVFYGGLFVTVLPFVVWRVAAAVMAKEVSMWYNYMWLAMTVLYQMRIAVISYGVDIAYEGEDIATGDIRQPSCVSVICDVLVRYRRLRGLMFAKFADIFDGVRKKVYEMCTGKTMIVKQVCQSEELRAESNSVFGLVIKNDGFKAVDPPDVDVTDLRHNVDIVETVPGAGDPAELKESYA